MEHLGPQASRTKTDKVTPLNYDNQATDKVVDIAIARMKVGSVAREERSRKTKKALISSLFIVAFGLLLIYGSATRNATTVIGEAGDVNVTLQQDRNGHYFAAGEINGYSVTFLVDTGATRLAIPEHIADNLNLKAGRKSQSYTANGVATTYRTRLDSVSLGGITLANIDASISSGLMGDEILLGMSFLKHLDLEQKDGVLTLRLN